MSSDGHHNWRQWTLNWLQCVFHRWRMRPWPLTCCLLAKCIAEAEWMTDWTKEARHNITLARTQWEATDVLCPFSANSAPRKTTRLFEKALECDREGRLLTTFPANCRAKKSYNWIVTCNEHFLESHLGNTESTDSKVLYNFNLQSVSINYIS